jgi:GT2 family glycosyltransferase
VSIGSSVPESGNSLSVGVLVLNYNTWDLALRALNAAIRIEANNIAEYVLFDDGSAARPPAEIDRRIRLIREETNRGFGRSLPMAFAAMKSDIVVLFDSDAYPLTPFAAKVREQFQSDPRLGQLGFRAEDGNGSQTESYFNEPTQWSLILGQALHAKLRKKALRLDKLCIITGCMATRMKAYANIGGFDPGFEFLDADVDYSINLRRHGWKIEVEPSIAVFHVGGTSRLSRSRVRHFYESRWRLLRKWGLLLNPWLARPFILARLGCERAILQAFGRFIFSDGEVLRSKISGRTELIEVCRTTFR